MPRESSESFSLRNQFSSGEKEITVREDAPEPLRVAVLEIMRELGWTPTKLRGLEGGPVIRPAAQSMTVSPCPIHRSLIAISRLPDRYPNPHLRQPGPS